MFSNTTFIPTSTFLPTSRFATSSRDILQKPIYPIYLAPSHCHATLSKTGQFPTNSRPTFSVAHTGSTDPSPLSRPAVIKSLRVNRTLAPDKTCAQSLLSDFQSFIVDSPMAIDPIKNVPVRLIDASGALQLDDGSFSSVSLSHPLMHHAQKKPIDTHMLRQQLAKGFHSGMGTTLLLTALFGIWYCANIAFNVFNKQVLQVFPYPITCTIIQFAVASAIMSLGWLLRTRPIQKTENFPLKSIVPLGLLHAVGFLLTNISLGKVSVAFAHTIKSTEPFFAAALTPNILGGVPTWGIVGPLLSIISGIAIASVSDTSFNWFGFFSAIGSNLALQSRNILTKRMMNSNVSAISKSNKRQRRFTSLSNENTRTLNTLDNIDLFSTMSMISLLVLIPVGLLVEGIPLLSSAVSPIVTGIPTMRLFQLLFFGGLYRCMDVLASCMILERVSPGTHSIGNFLKRAIVITGAIFVFHTKMTPLNMIGTTLVLGGVLFYSLFTNACNQSWFGSNSSFLRPIYSDNDSEFTEGGGI